jgi:sigma-54-dependent transcriptional regulator
VPDELSGSLHETSFLPQARPWQSLLCVPLVNPQSGGRVIAVRQPPHVELQGFADSLGRSAVVLGHLHLLQRCAGRAAASYRWRSLLRAPATMA